jgi:hypothetical protein
MKSRAIVFSLKAGLLAGLVSLSGISSADDTEIYIGNNNSTSAAPMVMFSIDTRPSAGATFNCTSMAPPDNSVNPPTVGCLYYLKKQPATACEFASPLDGAVDSDGTPCTSLPAGTLTGANPVGELFTFLRLSMKIALSKFEGKGVNVGLMISGDNKGVNDPDCWAIPIRRPRTSAPTAA